MTRHRIEDAPLSPFNSPLECGLRCAVLLAAAYPAKLDIQRIVNYDYLLVHSGDVANGPSSIHPPTPHRSGELLVRRPTVEGGIRLMMSKSIIECEFSMTGILYFAGEWSVAFLNGLNSKYASEIKQRAQWVIQHFALYEDAELTKFMRQNWSVWGAEFEFEALVRRND